MNIYIARHYANFHCPRVIKKVVVAVGTEDALEMLRQAEPTISALDWEIETVNPNRRACIDVMDRGTASWEENN